MSSLKRHFTAIIGSKEHGLYISTSPSSAARKIVSKLCASSKSKKVEFCVREITQKSEKKTYGPYLGEMKKLVKPIELKGRIIRYAPEVHLKKKKNSTAKSLKKTSKKMKGGVVPDLFLIKEYCNINNSKIFSQNRGNTYYSPTDDAPNVKEIRKFEKRYIIFGKPEFIHFRKNIQCHPLYYQYIVYYENPNGVIFEMYNSFIKTVEKIYIIDINRKSLYELKLFLEQQLQTQDIYYYIIYNIVNQYLGKIEIEQKQLQQQQQREERLQEQQRQIQLRRKEIITMNDSIYGQA